MSKLCRGLVIYHGDDTVVVTTPAGHNGFPKGKPKKVPIAWDDNGKVTRTRDETPEETALRETLEETGFKPEQLQVLPTTSLLEYNEKGNPSVAYVPARFIGDRVRYRFQFDKKELLRVCWQTPHNVQSSKAFRKNRKELAAKALELLQSVDASTLIPGEEWVAHPYINPTVLEFPFQQ